MNGIGSNKLLLIGIVKVSPNQCVRNLSPFDALASSSFPSLTDFSAAAAADALKWIDLEQNVVYQIVSTRTVNTQHGQSVILSLQKAGGSSCSAWACDKLAKELLQNPMIW